MAKRLESAKARGDEFGRLGRARAVYIVLARVESRTMAARLNDDGGALGIEYVTDLAAFVAREEPNRPRWVWDETRAWYPGLLAAGVRIDRCFDLRLCHAILRSSSLTADSALAKNPQGVWDAPARVPTPRSPHGTLFDLETEPEQQEIVADPLAEFSLQRAAVSGAAVPGRISRLLAAESAGALIAAEMQFAGLPWRPDVHDRLLEQLLGPRPLEGTRPRKLAELLEVIRERLGIDDVNPDSPVDLVRALRVAGLQASSTRSWELRQLKHPAIPPLLEYKKLARLLSANGWHWLDTWVVDGRFRPDYVPGGVVTGRWATSGGGALQLPRQVRAAVVADEGWKLVVADAAQLEPRILAALSADRKMAEAGAAGDLYAGIVADGTVETREQAKVAMLGAMYGATSGEGGRLLPRLQRAYPRAIALVEEAARAGERGEIVTTRLGRSSPPGQRFEGWSEGRSAIDTDRARERARAWGRFTRNFIVQGTAAEWALCWMAGIRRRLHELDGRGFGVAPHLVFFLHDEVVVHTPAELAAQVEQIVRESAVEAGRLLFGGLPVGFPVTVATVNNYGEAK